MNLPDSFKNAAIPIFPFPTTVINYIFTNAQPHHYQKLNKVCKYIFARFQRNCINWIHLEENWSFSDEPPKPIFRPGYKFITKRSQDFALLSSNLWLYGYLELNRATTILYKSLMPKITKCTAANITLTRCADILYEDYKLLTESGKLETLMLHDTKVIYANGEAVEFEKILPHADGAIFVTIYPIHTTEKTMENLLNFQWKSKNKLMMLRLSKADNYVNPSHFFALLQKIACMCIMKRKDRCYLQFNNSEETKEFERTLAKKFEGYQEPVVEVAAAVGERSS